MNKFIQFLSLNKWFKQPPTEQELQMLAIQKQADTLLEHQTYSTFFQLVNSGYQMTPEQEKKIHAQFLHKVRRENLNAVNSMIVDGYYMTNETLAAVFFNYSFQEHFFDSVISNKAYDSEKTYLHVKELYEQIAQRIKQPECKQALLKEWEINLDRAAYIWNGISQFAILDSSYSKTYHYFKKDWFSNTSVEHYQSLLAKTKLALGKCDSKFSYDRRRNLENVFEDMNKNFSKVFTQQTNSLMEKTKNLYLSDRVDKIVAVSSAEQSKHYHVKNLPEHAQTIINDMEKNYLRITHNSDKVSQENMFIINKMMDERLPEIVRKYFSIDEEYRTTLKNHEGKHAGDLLLDSLSQLHEMMHNVVVSINEDKLTKMTVDNRYMTAVKKAF